MKTENSQKLLELRSKIDLIDDQLAGLLASRMQVVKEVGELKNAAGTPIYRPGREKEIISRITSSQPLPAAAIEAIFMEIFALSRGIEAPQTVAFLGPEATFTHAAARSRFGGAARYLALANIEAVFRAVSDQQATYGVVPVENNTEGTVGLTLDCLNKYESVKIIGEVFRDIHHCFATANEPHTKGVKKIFSHPQAYHQCLTFLDDHNLRECEFIPTTSTAAAAMQVASLISSGDTTAAAICPKIAANIANIPILYEKIEDNAANRTRFFILSNFKAPPTGHDKTAILAHTPHRSGALAELLNVFKDADINIVKLESRPAKKHSFDSLFYIGFEGHIDDQIVQQTLAKANSAGANIKWLGSYLNEERQ